ncbi:hypothetical protein [Chryseobacterium sp. SORGH_AS_1175]|uniref:hypothetical protein n=1 Tax=Chryseobacterium sp. SORGH_AS_1175 TaxID=3041760 RepID=UPI00286AAF93|nr:hypothetical protein [Chryseobacterium sp. SORGH_AS_1175]
MAVKKRIGNFGWTFRIIFAREKPSIFGIMMSRIPIWYGNWFVMAPAISSETSL